MEPPPLDAVSHPGQDPVGKYGLPLADLVLPEIMGSILEFQLAPDTVLFRMYITGDKLVNSKT
jgi:hypothetical protein